MQKTLHTWQILFRSIVLCCVLVLCACHDEPQAGGDSLISPDSLYVQVRFSLQSDASYGVQRAPQADTPLAGEDGDGREDGILNENTVHNAMIYLYDGGDMGANPTTAGPNSPASTPIKFSYYISSEKLRAKGGNDNVITDEQGTYNDKYTVVSTMAIDLLKNKDLLITANTQMIVVINLGDLSTYQFTTLGELRDFIAAYSWGQGATPDQCDYFAMSSSDASSISNLSGGTYDNPILFKNKVERMMARVDLCWYNTASLNTSLHLVIPAYDYSDQKIADVEMTNIRIFNNMQTPSYLLKRVSTGVDWNSLSVNCLGRETTNMQGVPTNYVIEPTTMTAKTALQRDGHDIRSLSNWYGETRYSNLDEAVISHPETLSIPNSRIHTFDCGASGNLQGVILGYANENTMNAALYSNNLCTGILFEAIYRPVVIYNSYDPETNVLHAADAYQPDATHPVWRLEILDEAKTELYFTSNTVAEALLAKHPEWVAQLTEFVGGRCYYALWLRHYNNGANMEACPMEYAIVRNNIYRVVVDAVRGMGAVEPEQTITNEKISPIIFVKPWQVRVMPEVIM